MRVTYYRPPGVDREAISIKAAHELTQGREVTFHDHSQDEPCAQTCWVSEEGYEHL